MEGMDLVRGVEQDLIKSKEIIKHTRDGLSNMHQQIALSSMDIMKMSRRKKRLEIIRNILRDVYKRFFLYTIEIDQLILH